MDSLNEIDITRTRVETILCELMRVEVHVHQNDLRIASICDEINRDCNGRSVSEISDKELTEYVRKYFRFRAVVNSSSHQHA